MKQKRTLLIIFFLSLFVFQQVKASANVLPNDRVSQTYSAQENGLPAQIYVNMLHLDLNNGGAVASPREKCGYLERADGCGEAGTQYPYSNPALVDVENDYLLDVLPREMNVAENNPPTREALQAQALAARSLADWKNRYIPDPYETNGYINNSRDYQVFIPYAYEYYSPSNGMLILEAVTSTRGQYLSYGGEAIDAEFGSDMKDRTIDEPSVPRKDYLRGVEEPISTVCGAVTNSNGYGMSQLGAYRWSRGNQCATAQNGNMLWPVRWADYRQILVHYYTGIDILDANGTQVAPDERWNLLWHDSFGSQIGTTPELQSDVPYTLQIRFQNTSVNVWTANSIKIGYRWYQNGQPIPLDPNWHVIGENLPEILAGGEYPPLTPSPAEPLTVTNIVAPSSGGDYSLHLGLSRDGIWISEQSLPWPDAVIDVHVNGPITTPTIAAETPTPTVSPTPTPTSPAGEGVVWVQPECPASNGSIVCDFPNPTVVHFVYTASWVPYNGDFTFRVYDTLNRPQTIQYVTYFTARLNGVTDGSLTSQCFYGWYQTDACGDLGSLVNGSFANTMWGGGLGNNFFGTKFEPNVWGARHVEAWLSIDAPYDPPPCASSCCWDQSSSAPSSSGLAFAASNVDRIAEQAALLYRLRDEAMKNTAEGERYIDLYYTHSAEIAAIMNENPIILEHGLDMIDALTPGLQALVDKNGETVTITSEQEQQAQAFLDLLIPYAGPGLQQAIAEERVRHPLDELVGMTMDQAWDHISNTASTPTSTASSTSTSTPTPTASPTQVSYRPIFSDGFESGSLSAWPGKVTNGGNLAVTSGSAYQGTYKMRALINDQTAEYVVSDSFSAEHYVASFAFSPHGIAMNDGTQLFIFNGWSGSSQLFRVILGRTSAGYTLKASVYNQSAWHATTPVSLSNTWHTINIDYYQYYGWGERTELSLILDGNTVGTLSYNSIDTNLGAVNSVRLGAQSIPVGASGTLWFDSFESREYLEPGISAPESGALPSETPTEIPTATGTP